MPRFDVYVAKASLAGTGLAVGIAGMAWHLRLLVLTAVALLAGAFLLRFAGRKSSDPPGA